MCWGLAQEWGEPGRELDWISGQMGRGRARGYFLILCRARKRMSQGRKRGNGDTTGLRIAMPYITQWWTQTFVNTKRVSEHVVRNDPRDVQCHPNSASEWLLILWTEGSRHSWYSLAIGRQAGRKAWSCMGAWSQTTLPFSHVILLICKRGLCHSQL